MPKVELKTDPFQIYTSPPTEEQFLN